MTVGPSPRRKRASRTADEAKTGAVRPWVFQRTVWVCALLIALDLVVYAPVWHHDFTDYDDPTYITQNPEVRSGLTWRGVVWAFTTGYAANWHPLTWLSHLLDVELYRLSPGPHHLTSVIVHIANTLLLFGVLRRMTGQVGRSALVAGLFGVHPLHVESVAWAAERKDVLSTLFWLLTLRGYVAYVRHPRVGRYLMVLALFALGLMAKPMLVTLPFVLLLLDVWPLRRLAVGPGSGHRPTSPTFIDRRAALEVVREKVPLLVLTVASSVVTFMVQRQGGAVLRLEEFPFGQRAANALVSYVAYTGRTVWPTGLAVFYPYPHALPEWQVIGSVLVLLGVTVGVIRLVRPAPYLLVGWFWYLGTLVPVIGLVQVGGQGLADRYTYIPLIGLFIILAWGIPDALARWPHRRIALPIAAGLAIVACMGLASHQVRYWKNSEALWTRAVDVTGDNWIAHGQLGNVLARSGRTEEAMAHYAEALRMSPDYAEAHNNLGVALAAQGRIDEAMREFQEALRTRPDYADAHFNVAAVLARKGQLAEATTHLETAIRLNPGFDKARQVLDALTSRRGTGR